MDCTNLQTSAEDISMQGMEGKKPFPCREWRKKKLAARKVEEEEAKKDRIKRGILTGWEIFMESSANIVDDDTAAGDDDMMWEINEEEEIRRMEHLSMEEQRRARREVRLICVQLHCVVTLTSLCC
jgi:hypothetical protein